MSSSLGAAKHCGAMLQQGFLAEQAAARSSQKHPRPTRALFCLRCHAQPQALVQGLLCLFLVILLFVELQGPFLRGSAGGLAVFALGLALFAISVGLVLEVAFTEPGCLPRSEELRSMMAGAETANGSDAPQRALEVLYAPWFGADGGSCLALALSPPDDEVWAHAVPGAGLKWCCTCCIWRPLGCSHCNHCGRCCLRWDHHCHVLGVCIGRRNHPHFFLIVLCSTLCSTLVFVTGLFQFGLRVVELGIPLRPALPGLPDLEILAQLPACAKAGLVLVPLSAACCNTCTLLGVPRCALTWSVLATAYYLCSLAVLLLRRGEVDGALVISVLLSGAFSPFALGALAAQCDAALRGMTIKSQHSALQLAEALPPHEFANLARFLAAPRPPSCVRSIG